MHRAKSVHYPDEIRDSNGEITPGICLQSERIDV